jgi:hypothetical protein
MKFIRIITITLFCLSGALCDARPPKVIKMYPENGAVDVKPGPIKIRFLFDQDMRQRGHSLCGGGENFPEIIGEPKWASKRAFVFSANLEANHDYSFGVNCPSAQGCSVPYRRHKWKADGSPNKERFSNMETSVTVGCRHTISFE